MPKLFHERGNISMVDLLAEVGNPSMIDEITIEDLVQGLRDHPEAVDFWIQQSEDNRSSPAWYIRQKRDDTLWEVGYYPDGESTDFENSLDACANYIRQYLDLLCRNKQ